ncbi:MAG: alkaline phosphatase D family protein [Bryobacterales bacterium]|nr:alkaline phosphatase D family protein [Bryobacterales bacterium]
MRFVPLCVILLLAGCSAPPPTEAPEAQPKVPEEAGGVSITHGPILGRLSSDSIGVWARTSRPAEVTVFYGKSASRLDYSRTFTTQPAKDNTGWILLESLDSSSKYYYEITTGKNPTGVERLSGNFHTLPSVEDVVSPDANPKGLFNLRFEFACGNNQNAGAGSAFHEALPAYATMRRNLVKNDEKSFVDFAILNGDWLYENDEARKTTVAQWAEQAGVEPDRAPKILSVAPALAGVWQNYKLYLEKGLPMADWHRYVPSYFTFDDHEIVNDVYGSGEVGRVDRRAVFRDIGLEGWYDYLGWANELPAGDDIRMGRARLEQGSDVLVAPGANFTNLKPGEATTLHIHWGTPDAGVMRGPDDSTGGDPNAGVYEIAEVLGVDRLRIRPAARASGEASYSIGKRSYWRKRVGNVDFYFLDTRTYREMHDVNNRNKAVSMLGKKQLDWLEVESKTSNADMIFVVSSVNLTIPHVGGTGSAEGQPENKDDAWTVFLKEREELIRIWDSLNKPVMVLTGDLHNSFAIQITDNVWEFASGPHNSVNHPASSEGGRPPNGKYDSFGRKVDIRWSTYLLDQTPNELRNRVIYTVVRVNNVFANEIHPGVRRWVAYPRPQVVFQFYDGVTGELLYAESVMAK